MFNIVGSGTASLSVAFAGYTAATSLQVATPQAINWSGVQTLTGDTAVANADLSDASVSGDYQWLIMGDLRITGTSTIDISNLTVDGTLVIDGATLVLAVEHPDR